VTQDEIDEFTASIDSKFLKYTECSAKTRINVDECFYTAVRAIRTKNAPAATKKSKSRKNLRKISPSCSLL
ncbi:MAG: hypothetical protein NXI00_23955, partial [Cytophagales bacterium]|nr:hypothetical protein [Cytophagales bacterium]